MLPEQRRKRMVHGGQGIVVSGSHFAADESQHFLDLVRAVPIPGRSSFQRARAVRCLLVELLANPFGFATGFLSELLPSGPVERDPLASNPEDCRLAAPLDFRYPFQLRGGNILQLRGQERRSTSASRAA